MGGSHYYDDKTFTTVLKDISGNTSIIYRYDEDYTYLASNTSIYHTTTDISNIRFHNQIMGISGETITHAIGKDIPDVSLNKYTSNGGYTGDISMVDITGIPFIGYYSNEIIQDTPDVKVFDLFQYKAKTYTFVPLELDNETYTQAQHLSDTEYEDFTYGVKFKYVSDTWEKYSVDNVASGTFYSPPTPTNYSYNRIESYKYPTINVNNVVTNRGESESSEWKPIKDKIPTELVLPTLP